MAGRRVVIGSTFVSGEAGIGARFYVLDDGSVCATLTPGKRQEGPPGLSHGGALAALLDEAMGAAAWAAGHRVLAVNLNVSFKQPIALGTEIRVVGYVERVEGRKVFTAGQITLPDGSTAAESTGIFVEAPNFFDLAGFSFESLDSD
jgi:uncharacterized protein (TIGR00369 family)